MELTHLWFVLIGFLFTGYFLLEGFDFGVGMLLPILGKGSDTRRRVVLNTIGPVWDGNEVWLITAGGALFAAFPEWYASLFSGFYLALLVLLVALILRICAIEYRGKIDSPQWRAWCDRGIGFGSWVPALAWGWVFANILRGVPIDSDKHVMFSTGAFFNGYAIVGALAFSLLFALHGSVFLMLKTGGEVRADAVRIGRWLLLPTAFVVAVFAVWTQLEYGHGWTWSTLVAAVIGLVGAAVSLVFGRDGWAFVATCVVIISTLVLLFGSLFPNVLPATNDPAHGLTIFNASATPYTLRVMSWAALVATPVVLGYQAWTYWVFRKRLAISDIPAGIGLPGRIRSAETNGQP